MGPVSTPPIEEAKSIFTDLGYSVTGDGLELRAERKWREVRVTPVANRADQPPSPDALKADELRCFVTWRRNASSLRERLRRLNLDCEWAVIGVGKGGDYEVARAPSGPATGVYSNN